MRTILEVQTKPWYSNQERYEDTQYQLDPNYDPSQDDYVAIPNGPYSESPWSSEIDGVFYVMNPLFTKSSYPDDGDPVSYPTKYSLDPNTKIVTMKVAGDYRIVMDTQLNCQFYGWAQNIKVEMIRRNDTGDYAIDTYNPITSIKSTSATDNDPNVLFDSTHTFDIGDKLIFKITALGESYTVSEVDGAPFINTEIIDSEVNISRVRTAGGYAIQSV